MQRHSSPASKGAARPRRSSIRFVLLAILALAAVALAPSHSAPLSGQRTGAAFAAETVPSTSHAGAGATGMPALRAQESVAQRPRDSQESASRLLDGFVRYTLRDYARAREILEPLALEGDADAQQLVGGMHANGEGVPQDSARAAHWLARSAEQGKVDAKFALGIMYRDGAGVPKDRALALTWLRRAAEQQHSDAANSLGELYLESGGTADQQEAAAWFERAALIGNGTAQFNLGVLFALGQGVRQSQVQAYKWFALSARSTLDAQRDIAVRELLAMRERMMPSQVEAADLLLRDWVSRSQWARWGRWVN